MNKMNTSYKLTTLIVVVALVLILVLFSAGVIDASVASIFGAIIGLAALVLYVNSPTPNVNREEEKIQRAFEKTKVQRTREGTAFEMATALILVCSVVVGVATHTFEQRTDILPEYLCFFIVAIAGLFLAYHPMSAFSVALSKSITNAEQFKLPDKRDFPRPVPVVISTYNINCPDILQTVINLRCGNVTGVQNDFTPLKNRENLRAEKVVGI